jgi:hypothetical protein
MFIVQRFAALESGRAADIADGLPFAQLEPGSLPADIPVRVLFGFCFLLLFVLFVWFVWCLTVLLCVVRLRVNCLRSLWRCCAA